MHRKHGVLSRFCERLIGPAVSAAARIGDLLTNTIRGPALCALGPAMSLILAGAPSLCLAEPANPGGSRRVESPQLSGRIHDPQNPGAYMKDLAGRMGSADGRSTLLKPIETRKKSEPAERKPAGNTPASLGDLPFEASQFPRSAEPSGKKPPANVINGLSPTNHAAKRALADMGLRTNSTAQPSDARMSIVGTRHRGNRPKETANHARPYNTSPASSRTLGGEESRMPASLAEVAEAMRPAAKEEAPSAYGGRLLASAKPGLTLWSQSAPTNFASEVPSEEEPSDETPRGNVPLSELPVEDPSTPPEGPWSLGSDLDKYRAHAVREGSRDSFESLGKAFERAGMTLGDCANIFVLGYASERAAPFRANDGKGLLDEPGKVPAQAGATVVSLGDGIYSLADLVTLDSLPNARKAAYEDNHPVIRPLVFTGEAIGGAWKTTEEVGNALTWGYFDNFTGCIGLCIESLMEVFKHTGQAVTNLARGPVHLLASKSEQADRAMDWVLLVPLEFATNSAQMKGIANMSEYETAFADKGVIGSVLEFGGSTFIAYRTIDELFDDDDKPRRRSDSQQQVDPPATEPPPTQPSGPLPTEFLFYLDGEWPIQNSSGVILYPGKWPRIWRGSW